MIKLKNYIFYRTYIEYLKKNDPARFASSLYLSAIEFTLVLPVFGFILELFRYHNVFYGKLIFVLLIIIIALNLKYYFNDGILKNIITSNKNNKYNKTISKWWFFCILPLSMIIGFGSHILISIHIVKEYNLQGFLYKLVFI